MPLIPALYGAASTSALDRGHLRVSPERPSKSPPPHRRAHAARLREQRRQERRRMKAVIRIALIAAFTIRVRLTKASRAHASQHAAHIERHDALSPCEARRHLVEPIVEAADDARMMRAASIVAQGNVDRLPKHAHVRWQVIPPRRPKQLKEQLAKRKE